MKTIREFKSALKGGKHDFFFAFEISTFACRSVPGLGNKFTPLKVNLSEVTSLC